MNGSIKVFSIATGNLNGVLENDDTINEAMPISRIKCKPGGDSNNSPLLAATYVSGHLRVWNYVNGQCVGQVCIFIRLIRIYSLRNPNSGPRWEQGRGVFVPELQPIRRCNSCRP